MRATLARSRRAEPRGSSPVAAISSSSRRAVSGRNRRTIGEIGVTSSSQVMDAPWLPVAP